MPETLITIAIPTKDSAKTVEYTLKSIYRQVIPRNYALELVVVDGYSKDSTVKIVKEWIKKLKDRLGDRLIRYEILYEKVGIGFARQLALKESQGDWILWVDSDNILSQNYIAEAMNALEYSEPNVAVLYPKEVKPIYDKPSLTRRALLCLYLLQQHHASMQALLNAVLEKLETSSIHRYLPYTAMQGTLCNTKVLRDVGGFDHRLAAAAEDIDLFLRLINKGYRMKPFNGVLYHFIRDTFRSWFKEAIAWDLGKQFVLSKFRACQDTTTRNLKGFPSIKIYGRLTTSAINFIKHLCCVKVCGLYGLLSPWLYIYRRAGYLIGILEGRIYNEYRHKRCVDNGTL